MNVIYIYGSSGTAKTTVAIEYLKESCGDRGFFSVTDYRRDPWDGYAGEKGLLLDELRLPTPVFGMQEMLQMLDGTPYQLSRRYANSWSAFDLVVVTSNWSPGGTVGIHETFRPAVVSPDRRRSDGVLPTTVPGAACE